jgi:hypothetical protein
MPLRPFDSCTSELSTRRDSVVLTAVCKIGVGPREARSCLKPLRIDRDALRPLVSEEIKPEIRRHRDTPIVAKGLPITVDNSPSHQ